MRSAVGWLMVTASCSIITEKQIAGAEFHEVGGFQQAADACELQGSVGGGGLPLRGVLDVDDMMVVVLGKM